MRAIRTIAVLVLAMGALLGVQAQSVQAKLTPAQVVLKEDRKALYDVELSREKAAIAFVAQEAKEATTRAKLTRKAAGYRAAVLKIDALIAKAGGTLSEAQLAKAEATKAALEAKELREETALAEATARGELASQKRHAVLAKLAAERAALEAKIVIDEEAVAAEGL